MSDAGLDQDTNCKFAVRSWHVMTPQGRVTNLTYGVVYTALRGLAEYMLFPEPHCLFISFTVRGITVGGGECWYCA